MGQINYLSSVNTTNSVVVSFILILFLFEIVVGVKTIASDYYVNPNNLKKSLSSFLKLNINKFYSMLFDHKEHYRNKIIYVDRLNDSRCNHSNFLKKFLTKRDSIRLFESKLVYSIS